MLLIWIILNLFLYAVGIWAYSKTKTALGTVLCVFGSVGMCIGLFKLLFYTDELWVIFLIGGPLLLIANVVARAVGHRIDRVVKMQKSSDHSA